MTRRILITSALPYANGDIHFGHIMSTYLPADVYSRYCKLAGYDSLYICASDEHGTPIELAAQKQERTRQFLSTSSTTARQRTSPRLESGSTSSTTPTPPRTPRLPRNFLQPTRQRAQSTKRKSSSPSAKRMAVSCPTGSCAAPAPSAMPKTSTATRAKSAERPTRQASF